MTIEYGDSRLPDRFWDKVHPVPEMADWVWTGAIKGLGGNPTYTLERRVTTVLQVYFRTFFPDVDSEEYRPRLSCGVFDCVNPNHVIIVEKGVCLKGHKAPKVGGGGCSECKHQWYLANRKSNGKRRPSKNEKAGVKTTVRTPTEFTVFGDRKPDKPWRPAGWSEQPKVNQNPWSQQSREQERELEHSG